MNAAPDSATLLGFVLTSWICIWLGVPGETVAGENDLPIVTLVLTTFRPALARPSRKVPSPAQVSLLVTPWSVVTELVGMTLVSAPGGVDAGTSTLTAIEQFVPPFTLMPEKPIVDPPAGALIVAPVQFVVTCGGVAITMPAGSVSVPLMLVSVSTPAAMVPKKSMPLLTTIVNVAVLPAFTVAGENDLVSRSGVATQMEPATAVALLPTPVTMFPAGMVLVCSERGPGMIGMWMPVLIVQDPEAGIVPPVSTIVVPPVGAFTVPPVQVVAGAGVAATVNPVPIVARSSVTEITLIGAVVLLTSVIVAT